jgi:hypothetical protein
MGKSSAVPLRPGVGGRLASARSKTGNPACSQAMSAWVRGRKTGIVSAAVYAMLGKCRAMARMLRSSEHQAAAGNPLKAQAMAARAKRGVTAQGRAELARQKIQDRHIKQRQAANAAFVRGTPAQRAARAAEMRADRWRRDRGAARPATVAAAPAAPAPPAAEFKLREESVKGKKTFKPVNEFAGKTGTMFDMKRGDLKGQTSLMDRVGTVDTRAAAKVPAKPVQKLSLKELREKAGLSSTISRDLGRFADVHGDAAVKAAAASARRTAAAVKNREMKKAARLAMAEKLRAGRRSGKGEVISRQSSNFNRKPERVLRVSRPADERGVHDRSGALQPVKQRFGAKAGGPQGPSRFTQPAAEWKSNRTEKSLPQVAYGKGPAGPAAAVEAARKHQLRTFGASLFGRGESPLERSRRLSTNARAEGDLGAFHRHNQDEARLTAAKYGTPESVLERGRASMDSRSKTAAKLAVLAKLKREQVHPETHGQVGKTYEVGTDKVHFDPDRFQYKLAAQGAHGTTEALKDVKKWDPELAGVVSVWKDPANGKTYVVNGHHRLDLAKRLGVKSVTAKYLDAPTAEQARAKGALVNIAEGRGTATDAAKFFRDTGLSAEHLKAKGVSLKEHTASQGLAMAGLEEHSFKRVVNGELSPARAAIIGGSGLSHEQQRALVKVLDKPKNRKLSDGTVRNLADSAREAGSRTKTTRDLFGSNEEEEALFVHRAKVEDTIKRQLSDDKRLFGLVSKSKAAAKLEERGRSSIDLETTGAVGKESAAILGVFDSLKHRDKRISAPLNRAAERIANGEPAKKVESETREEIAKHIKAILSGDADVFG